MSMELRDIRIGDIIARVNPNQNGNVTELVSISGDTEFLEIAAPYLLEGRCKCGKKAAIHKRFGEMPPKIISSTYCHECDVARKKHQKLVAQKF